MLFRASEYWYVCPFFFVFRLAISLKLFENMEILGLAKLSHCLLNVHGFVFVYFIDDSKFEQERRCGDNRS